MCVCVFVCVTHVCAPFVTRSPFGTPCVRVICVCLFVLSVVGARSDRPFWHVQKKKKTYPSLLPLSLKVALLLLSFLKKKLLYMENEDLLLHYV